MTEDTNGKRPTDYYDIPEIGYAGGKSLEARMQGLDFLLEECRGKAVLDVGCATGAITAEFAKRGASRVVGIDAKKERIDIASRTFADLDTLKFKKLTISEMSRLGTGWDIILFLAVLHKRKTRSPDEVVKLAVSMGAKFIAVKCPSTWKSWQALEVAMRRYRFRQLSDLPNAEGGNERGTGGRLKVYKKR